MMKNYRILVILLCLCGSTLNLRLNATTYFLKAGGTITNPADWGDNAAGTTNSPADFTGAHTWSFNNNNGSVTLSAPWTLDAGSTVIFGDGTNAFTFFMADKMRAVNVIIQASAVLDLSPANELTVEGDFTNNGTITSSGLSTTLLALDGGTTAQTISGNAFTVGSIRCYSGSRGITLSTGVTVLDSLKVEANVTFASGGNLRLNADAGLKGRVAQLGSGASVTGNVIAELFIPGPTTGWANMGSFGIDGMTVANWDGQIPMTCNGCINPTTSIPGGFESIMGWSEPSSAYTTLLSSTPLLPGEGFWVYVGDGYTTTNDLKIVNTGNLTQGLQNQSCFRFSGGANAGFNLLSNPFPSPISWTDVLAASGGTVNGSGNLLSAIYVYNADLGVTTSFVPGVGSSHANGITDVLPAGQGFYVEVDPDLFGVTVVFPESAKRSFNTGANPLLKGASSKGPGQFFRLYVQGGNNDVDETAFFIHPQASTAFEYDKDAKKMFATPGYPGYPGPYTAYTSISSRLNNVDYSINSFPIGTNSVSIPILVKAMTTGNYTISAKDFENYSSCLFLKDNLTGVYTDLMKTSYVCMIADTTQSPRFELLLCQQQGANPNGLVESVRSQYVNAFGSTDGVHVDTRFETRTNATISVYNLLGQKLTEDKIIDGTETHTVLNVQAPNQVLIVNVKTADNMYSKKVITR
jgi:hypothetical protein